jgi:predicted ABC-type ATPase
VAKEGKAYKAPTEDMPERYRSMRGQPKMCFQNSTELAMMHPELKYVEGYASPPGIGLPIHHAWCVDKDGNVVDPTWKHGTDAEHPAAYRGIEVSPTGLSHILDKTGHYGVLDHRDSAGLLERPYMDTKLLLDTKRSGAMDEQLGTHLDTKDKHTNDGKYTAERGALHRTIMQHFLDRADYEGTDDVGPATPQKEKRALFMAGGPASGKTVLAKSGLIDVPKNAVSIDPDAIMSMLPEVKALYEHKGEREVGNVGHEEAADIAKMLHAEATKRGLNMVIDGSGDSQPGKFVSKLKKSHDDGYNVDVAYADVPTKLALERSKSRGEKTGRYVPDDLLKSMHAGASERFDEVKGIMPQLHSLGVYDTTDGAAPLAHMEDGKMIEDNPVGMRAFEAKRHEAEE